MANRPRVSLLPLPGLPGRLHLSALPGTWAEPGGAAGVARDLAAIAGAGASVLVSLVQARELPLPVEAWGTAVGTAGMAWVPLPVPDFGVPDDAFEAAWAAAGLADRLRAGETVAIHCRAGLGRTGMIAARLLVEVAGLDAAPAIAMIRRDHAGEAVETAAQEAHVERIAAAARGRASSSS